MQHSWILHQNTRFGSGLGSLDGLLLLRQGLEEQRNFWKSCWWKTAGNARVQVFWESYRSHDGCDFTVHRGNDTICHPGLTQARIHSLVGFVIHESTWHMGKLLLAGC